MNRTFKKALVAGAALLPLLMAGSVYADTIDITAPSGFEGLDDISFTSIFSAAITILFIVAAVVAFIFLVLGGIKWITSGGDKAKTEEARNMITAALVGLLIVFAAWAIMSLIQTFFGINIWSFTIPDATS